MSDRPIGDQEVRLQRLAALGELLASVSHETRNILTALLSFAQVGKRKSDQAEKVEEIFGLIERESIRCLELFEDVLAVARSKNLGDGKTAQSAPNEVLEGVRRLVGHRMSMSQIQFVMAIPDSLPDVAIGNLQFSQILINLLLNAMQAAGNEGEVRAAVFLEDDRLRIDVDDSGPGVAPGDRERIFEAFFTTRETGTGLGLAVSRRLALEHGGVLTVSDSRLGGARFSVLLPVVTEEAHDQ